MSFPDVIDLCSDDEVGEANGKVVKQEPGVDTGVKHNENSKHQKIQLERSKTHTLRQEPPENGSSRDQGTSDASRLPPAPIIRQFWKAGEYDQAQAPKVILESGQNRLRVHPKFLHSNATSHKWAFGAIAELLDNAFDEIQKGASFVMVDKVSNSRDGSPALLIQDDGGGMDPESMRRCMSFGFSDKKSKSAIGHYGNGFKTSTMRLGADVIAFSRHVHKSLLDRRCGNIYKKLAQPISRDQGCFT